MFWVFMFFIWLLRRKETKSLPVKITNQEKEVAFLCDDCWDLPIQIENFEKWLLHQGVNLLPSSYVADIGFSPREGAAGGGGCLSIASMKIMTAIGMELCLSEYPEFTDHN